jgi:hypothetical protein
MRRRRRWRLGRSESGPEEFSSTSIFITPMLDMSFQILAFFVFTFQPTPPEGEIPIGLTSGAAAGEQAAQDPKQTAAPGLPRLRPYVSLRADGAPGGALGRMEILFQGQRILVADSDGPAGAGPKAIPNLRTALLGLRRQIRLDPADPRSLSLSVQFHPEMRWGDVVRLLDACRRMTDEQGQAITLFPQLELEPFQ